jgi:hypothetical protein
MTQLWRGSKLRLIDGDPEKPPSITPHTSVLRNGLDQAPRSAIS